MTDTSPTEPSSPGEGPNDGGPSSSELSRGLVRKVMLSGVLAAIVFAGLAFYGDIRKLGEDARDFQGSAFGLALALVLGNYAIRIVRWQYYLKRIDVHLPIGESSLVFLSGFVMSVTPGKVGEVFKSLLLYESRSIPATRTAPVVIAERLTDLIALASLVAIASFAFEHGVAIAASSALVVFGLLVVCAYRPLGNLVLDLAARVPMLRKISPRLREAYASLWVMTRPVPLVVGSALALLGWSLECAAMYAIVHGFAGATLSWDGATFAYSASTLIGALAMMPGGLGVTEVGMTTLLTTLGAGTIRTSVASATTILVRLATLWFAVAVGVPALALYRRLYARSDE